MGNVRRICVVNVSPEAEGGHLNELGIQSKYLKSKVFFNLNLLLFI